MQAVNTGTPLSDHAHKILADWRAQAPFERDDLFSHRLAESGATESDWLAAFSMGNTEEVVRDHPRKRWLTKLYHAYTSPESNQFPPDFFGENRCGPLGGLLALVRPLMEEGCRRLQTAAIERWQDTSNLPFKPDLCAALMLGFLPEHLLEMSCRTLVLEMHVARLQGLLRGETPAARYQNFVTRLENRAIAWQLLAEYPVLARRLEATVETWIESSLYFLGHLAADQEDIESYFGSVGLVTAVSGGAGDAHRGGRTVHIVTFASGLKLVYKPRPLAVDNHFQALLQWCNQRGVVHAFPIMKVLECGDHGWQEFIPTRPCQHEQEIARFYERVGGFLALFHLLEATDFHFENLIACGEHPYPVDLETLFHPRLRRPEMDMPDIRITSEAVGASVLRVGILPFRIGEMADNPGLDISGLASVEGQLSPDLVLQWQAMATDEMSAHRQRVALPAGQNQPRLSDRDTDTLAYAVSIVAGFKHTWRLLREHRQALISPTGPLAAFNDDQIRVVLRPTRAYHLILTESHHPDLLRDGLRLDRHFDRLWSGLDERPQLLPVVASERSDLAAGDIPFFTTTPASRALRLNQNQSLDNFFDEAAMEAVHGRLHDWDEDQLARQVWFIEAALGTLALSRDDLDWPSYPLVEPACLPSMDDLTGQLLEKAHLAGERLEELAFREEGEVTWVGLTFASDRWSLVTLMEDLYSGTPGIILFLAQLGVTTDSKRFTNLAKAATNTLRGRLEHTRDDIKTLGLFQGWGSLIYLFTHLAGLWRDEALLAEAEACLDRLDPLIDSDDDLDLIGGCAGCISALLALHQCNGSKRALELALRCGDHLLARAEHTETGIAWSTPVGGGLPLLGLSHGSAGFAHALFALAKASGHERFQTAALAASRYEHETLAQLRSQDEDQKAQRRPGEVQALAVAWCYGSAGVGIARLRALRSVQAPWLRQDLEEAIDQILADGFGRNHSLCHGDLGNLDFILQAAHQLGGEKLAHESKRLTAIILTSIETHGFRCGTPLCAESPSLMNGLAGIGHGLLRAAFPERIPSILACDPPTTSLP